MAAAADLRESLRQRARTQVQQESVALSPTSAAAAPDGDRSMDDALADFKKKAAAGRTRRASISIGGRARSASLSPAEVSAATAAAVPLAVPLLCSRSAAALSSAPAHGRWRVLQGADGLRRRSIVAPRPALSHSSKVADEGAPLQTKPTVRFGVAPEPEPEPQRSLLSVGGRQRSASISIDQHKPTVRFGVAPEPEPQRSQLSIGGRQRSASISIDAHKPTVRFGLAPEPEPEPRRPLLSVDGRQRSASISIGAGRTRSASLSPGGAHPQPQLEPEEDLWSIARESVGLDGEDRSPPRLQPAPQLASFRSGGSSPAASALRRASIDITNKVRAQAQEAVRAELSRGSPGALLVSAAALSSPNERSMDDALAEFKKTAKATAGRRASISIGGKTRSASLAPGLGAVVSALPSCPAVCCVCSYVGLLCGLPSLTPSPLRACVMRVCVRVVSSTSPVDAG